MNHFNHPASNDRKLIDGLITHELESMYRYACYRLGDRAEARDLIHELYLRLLRSEVGRARNPRCYLYRALSNACTQHLRGSQRREFVGVEALSSILPEELDPSDFEQEQALIERLMATLGEEQREVVRLHLHCGFTFAEVAEILEIPLPTAKSRYRYAIEHLREKLHRQGLI